MLYTCVPISFCVFAVTFISQGAPRGNAMAWLTPLLGWTTLQEPLGIFFKVPKAGENPCSLWLPAQTYSHSSSCQCCFCSCLRGRGSFRSIPACSILAAWGLGSDVTGRAAAVMGGSQAGWGNPTTHPLLLSLAFHSLN